MQDTCCCNASFDCTHKFNPMQDGCRTMNEFTSGNEKKHGGGFFIPTDRWVIQTFKTSMVDLFCECHALSAVWVHLPIHSDEDAFVDSGNGFWSGERCNSSRGRVVDFLRADTIRESWRWVRWWSGLAEGDDGGQRTQRTNARKPGFVLMSRTQIK